MNLSLIDSVHRFFARPRNQVSLVPLIDVVFILLLFFLLSTQLNVLHSVHIEFPILINAQEPVETHVLILEDNNRTFSYAGVRYVDLDSNSLVGLLPSEPSTIYVIRSQPSVDVQGLLSFVDDLSIAGIKNIIIFED